MRRESDNLNNSSSNTPHSSYTTNGDNNLTHLNYPHPVHGYSAASYSGYPTSKHMTLYHSVQNCEVNTYILP